MGLTSVAAAIAAGATVSLAARHDHQRQAAARLGAAVLEGPTDPGDGYDVVVEAAGTAAALAEAVERCRPGGRVVLLGSYWDGSVELPGTVCFQEIDLIPASMYGRVGPSRDFDVAVSILAARPEVAATLITHRFPLDAAADAFAAAGDRASGAIKVVLEP
jgi:threonine dehydrogenase-like Zn-dependent dehydrogenase